MGLERGQRIPEIIFEIFRGKSDVGLRTDEHVR